MVLQNAESGFASSNGKPLLNGTTTTSFPLQPTKPISLSTLEAQALIGAPLIGRCEKTN